MTQRLINGESEAERMLRWMAGIGLGMGMIRFAGDVASIAVASFIWQQAQANAWVASTWIQKVDSGTVLLRPAVTILLIVGSSALWWRKRWAKPVFAQLRGT